MLVLLEMYSQDTTYVKITYIQLNSLYNLLKLNEYGLNHKFYNI